MKPLLPLTAVFALTLAGVSAQDSPLASPLRKFDTNKDGKLTGDELVMARQAFNRGGRNLENGGKPNKEFTDRAKRNWRERNFKSLDLNGNGSLEEEENKRAETVWEAVAVEQEKLRVELLRKFDKNDDGELSQSEREASRGEFEGKRREIEKKVMDAQPKPAAPGP